MKKRLSLAWSLSALALVFACGGNDGVNDGGSDAGTGSTGNGAGTGSTGNGASNGSGASGNGSGSTGNGLGGTGAASGGSFPDDTFEYDPSNDAEPTSCVDQNVGTDLLPVDMFIMLDKSGSMTQPHGNNDSDGYCDVDEANWEDNGSRWCNSINALQDFFEAGSSVGLGLSLGAFSGDEPTTKCVAATSMSVPFGVIQSGDANGLLASTESALNGWTPNGSTPTEYAINTLIAKTVEWRDSPSNTRDVPIVAILITDGAPNSNCEDSRSTLNETMKTHFEDEGIPFFIIGMDGVTASNLEGLASGAGASQHTNFCIAGDASCSYYSVGNGNAQTFVAALAEIQQAVMGCSFGIPSNGSGLVDLETAVVNFTPASGQPVEALTAVENVGACSTNKQYYVEGEAIQLCPATCDRVGDTSSVSINIKCAGN